jgi:hypothetical protein
MAADKEIMKAIERLRLDRPGHVHLAASLRQQSGETLGEQLTSALRALANTFREEAELWSRSGAKGWKGSEAEKYLVAQHVDDVAGQLDNAGGGAALSVSEPERKTAYAWNGDPRVDPFVASWSDFGASVFAQGLGIDRDALITLAEFEKARDGGAVTVGRRPPAATHERLDDLVSAAVAEGRGMLKSEPAEVPLMDIRPTGNDVEAYLKGEVDTLPGLAEALVPGSVTDGTVHLGRVELTDNGDGSLTNANAITVAVETQDGVRMVSPGDTIGAETRAKLDSLKDFTATMTITGPAENGVMPATWESDTLTADGHVKPGVAQTLAPTLGQPGDNSGGGYSHDYVPPGGRKLTFADLLQPVPAASLPPHLSHSQGNTISDCAAKYRMQRVDMLPQIPQWANIGGTAFHAAVEAFERTLVKMPHTPVSQMTFKDYDVELSWKHHFETTIAAVAATTTVPQSVWRASRRGAEGEAWWWVNGPKFLRAYLDARPDEPTSNLPNPAFPDPNGADPFQLAIELELTVDVPTPYGPIPFTAKLDRVTNAKQPGPDSPESNWITLVIRDYKTSYERPTDTTQLGDYAWTLRLSGVPESVRILGSYFDARRGTWTEPVDLLQAHPFEAFQYKRTTDHAQKRALTTGPTPARPSSFCGGCSVRYACPVMALKS